MYNYGRIRRAGTSFPIDNTILEYKGGDKLYMGTIGAIWVIELLIVVALTGLVIYALILAIIALRIYINKNQNYKQ
jgi:hypothetical protein